MEIARGGRFTWPGRVLAALSGAALLLGVIYLALVLGLAGPMAGLGELARNEGPYGGTREETARRIDAHLRAAGALATTSLVGLAALLLARAASAPPR